MLLVLCLGCLCWVFFVVWFDFAFVFSLVVVTLGCLDYLCVVCGCGHDVGFWWSALLVCVCYLIVN